LGRVYKKKKIIIIIYTYNFAVVEAAEAAGVFCGVKK
jgi:hypothetical protein